MPNDAGKTHFGGFRTGCFRLLVNFLPLRSNIALKRPFGGRVAETDRLEELRALKLLGPLVKDLHRPNPLIYWGDLAACLGLAVLGLYLSTPFPDTVLQGSVPAIIGIVVAGLALYRASYFNHELSHQARQLPGFEIGWNLFIGIPLLIPSFLYYDHLNHHSVRGFGTESDIEYFSPKQRGLRGAIALVAVSASSSADLHFPFFGAAPARLGQPEGSALGRYACVGPRRARPVAPAASHA